MAIHGQPNAWTCGPFALRHALLAHGLFARPEELARLAGSSEERGTDERQLKRAARTHRLDVLVERQQSARAARRALETWLARGIPVLLCVDEWEHWITAVAGDAEHVVVFDSKYDAPLRLEPWEPLFGRVGCRRHYLRGIWSRTVYDLHPVVPRRGRAARLELTPVQARELLAEENAMLARRWDDFARAVLPLALTSGSQLVLGLALDRYIAERRQSVVDLVERDRGGAARPAADRVLRGLAFAAGLYRATLRPELESTAPERLAGIVSDLLTVEDPGAGGRQAAAAA